MKPFRLLLTVLLPFLGNTVLAQSGMTVFGEVGVAEKGSMAFFDEQLVLRGDVTGEGELVMAGKDTQTIAAQDHTIDRLVVTNPKAVRVRGKLTVRKSITVEKGDLVVEPQARLVVLPGAQIALATDSRWIGSDGVIQSGPDAGSPLKQHISMGDALAVGQNTTHWGELKPGSVRWNGFFQGYQSPYLQNPALPPWHPRWRTL
ncbi:hypothetical protein ACO2Q8_26805 [Larkinella sp. VNQ87]|uniref:hypothetical protein n=1 Tax=Larkinella sp. VNQ87 TaxID=3400921 RepID=UPI003BFE5212